MRACAWLLHALALAAVLAVPAPALVRALLAAALLLPGYGFVRSRGASARRLDLAGDGRCTIVDARGGTLEGVLGAGSLALPGVVVLELDRQGRRRGLWLASDSFAVDELRRLRVRLRVAA